MTAPRTSAVMPRGRPAPARRPPAAPAPAPRRGLWEDLLGHVEWTPGYVAFLYYTFVVVTYWLPFADVAIVIALLAVLARPADWRFTPFLYVFGAFAAWCLLAFVGSPYRGESWIQTSAVLKLWLICFTAMAVIRSRAQLRFFLAFAIGAFILFPARGAFINYFGGYNVLGRALWNFAYANPNDLAAFALLFTSMSVALFFAASSRLLKLAAVGATGVLLLLILFTQSRGAILSIGVVGVLFLIANRRNGRVLMASVALAAAAAIFAPRSVWDRVAGLANASFSSGFKGVDQERSAEQRFQLLTVAIRVARDNMLAGVGPGVYPLVHGSYAVAAKGELPLAAGNRDPHNTVVRTAAETGVVGLGIFLIMIGQALFRARRRLKAGGKAADPVIRFLAYGLIAFMIAGLFGSFTYLNVLYLQLSMIEIALLLSSGARPAAVRVPVRRPLGPRRDVLRPATPLGA